VICDVATSHLIPLAQVHFLDYKGGGGVVERANLQNGDLSIERAQFKGDADLPPPPSASHHCRVLWEGPDGVWKDSGLYRWSKRTSVFEPVSDDQSVHY
jgi:hypothetical protein